VVGWLEYGRGKSAARTWIIDPIDGTKGFISGRHYAVGVGLLEDGQPTDAVIATPGYPHFGNNSAGALFYTKDGGAYVEPLPGGDPQPIRVSDRSEIESVRVVESVVSRHKDLSKLDAMRENAGIQPTQITEIDSMEKYAWIAADHAELYVRLPRGENPRHYIWDHAAGVALVRAAGGTATDLDGSPLDFSQGSTLGNQGVMTTNGRIHERMIEALQRALAE
jgi:3'-phosphoadenosine 5'-phosphosulfate (PAPS) 3'-phosphatase